MGRILCGVQKFATGNSVRVVFYGINEQREALSNISEHGIIQFIPLSYPFFPVDAFQVMPTQRFLNATTLSVRARSATPRVVPAKTIVSHAIGHRAPDASSWCVISVSSIALVTTFLWQLC